MITNDDESLTYQASSPDELALINAARFFNYKFIKRDINNNIHLKINGEFVEYTLLDVLEFNSDRLRNNEEKGCQ